MDTTDFERLVREHAGLVRSMVYQILRSPNDVEDVTQEVFIKAYQSLSSFRGGSFRAYISQIARNHCYDVLRKRRLRKAILDTGDLDENLMSTGDSPEDRMILAESAGEVQALLNEIPPLDKEILLMKHVYGFSYEEIAEAMNMRAGTVRTRVSRARTRLMSLMQGRENGEPSFMG